MFHYNLYTHPLFAYYSVRTSLLLTTHREIIILSYTVVCKVIISESNEVVRIQSNLIQA